MYIYIYIYIYNICSPSVFQGKGNLLFCCVLMLRVPQPNQFTFNTFSAAIAMWLTDSFTLRTTTFSAPAAAAPLGSMSLMGNSLPLSVNIR